MEIEVFKPINNDYEYESVAIIDVFNSLQTVRRFSSYNDFSLKVPLTVECLGYFVPESILLINDVFYYIDDIDGQGDDLTVRGNSLIAKSNGRIIDGNYNKQARPEVVADDLLDKYAVNASNGKRIELLSLANVSNLETPSIRYQNSYGEVLEAIESICSTHNIGFVERFKSPFKPTSEIEFVAVNDVSDVVEFSVKNENLLSESYVNNNFDEKNVAIVLGEGEGSARRKIIINDEITGLERKELYVDARDIQSEVDGTTLSNSEYDELLRERGKQKLAEHNKVLQLESEIDTRSELFEFGKDYDVGSCVSVVSEKYNMTYKAVIEEITETWDETGYYIEPQFGDKTPTILDVLKRS